MALFVSPRLLFSTFVAVAAGSSQYAREEQGFDGTTFTPHRAGACVGGFCPIIPRDSSSPGASHAPVSDGADHSRRHPMSLVEDAPAASAAADPPSDSDSEASINWPLSRRHLTRHPLVERYPNLRLLKKLPSVRGSDYVTPTETVAADQELHPNDVVLLYFNAPRTMWCEGCKDVNEKLVRFVENFRLEHTGVPRHERVLNEFVEQHPVVETRPWGAHIGRCPKVRVVFVYAGPKEGDSEEENMPPAVVGRRARSAVGEEWKNYWINYMPSDWLAVDLQGGNEAGTIPGGQNLPSARVMLRDLVPEPEGHIPALWAVYRSPTAAPPSRRSREQASPPSNSPEWDAFYFQPDNDQDWDAFVTATVETAEEKWKETVLSYRPSGAAAGRPSAQAQATSSGSSLQPDAASYADYLCEWNSGPRSPERSLLRTSSPGRHRCPWPPASWQSGPSSPSGLEYTTAASHGSRARRPHNGEREHELDGDRAHFDLQRARVHAHDIVVLYFPPEIYSGATTVPSSPSLRAKELDFLTAHVRAFARQLGAAVLQVQAELEGSLWRAENEPLARGDEVVVRGRSSEGVDDGSNRGRLAEVLGNRWTLAEFRVRVVFAGSSPSGRSGELSRAVFDDFASGAGWLYADRALFVQPVPQALQILQLARDESEDFLSLARGRRAAVVNMLVRAYETAQIEEVD